MNCRNVRILFCLGLFAQVAWGQNKDLNTITSVEIHGGRIEIIGTKQPSFTSFTMTDPARLVIDIAEAVFSGVPDQIPGSGTVSWIKTASYGSDSSAIARVLIGFSQDVETDVASPGNKLVIKVLNSAPPAVAGTEKPTGTTPKESTAAKLKDVGASAAVQTASPAGSDATVGEATRKKEESKAKETAMKAEEERLAQERAQKEVAKREEQERLAEARRAEAEKKRQAEEESKRLAEQNRLTEQQKRIEAEEAKRAAAAEEKRQAQEEGLAREKAKEEAQAAKRQAAIEQKQKAEDEQKRSADEERLAKSTARAEAEGAKREAAAEQKRKAQEEHLARKKELEEAANAKRQAAADRKQQAEQERIAKAKARHEALAAEREAKLAAKSGSPVAAGPSKRRATMTFVGFQRAATGARVYVRTNGPIHYTVQQEGDKKVVLELENTRIGTRNSRRPLDTSFFDTAVAMVSPNPAGNRTVRVEISLKEAASFQTKQDGNEVSVEFPRASRR
ncbi:MAG TPA: AMIN domain-containing protein [Myxococcaceae bacterium]|nr:AMIN domain-containing protein [Myxococcaceae bacterium]